jgi:hypothetical protein
MYWVDFVYRGKIEILHLADTTNTADYWNKVKTLTFNIPKHYISEPKTKVNILEILKTNVAY